MCENLPIYSRFAAFIAAHPRPNLATMAKSIGEPTCPRKPIVDCDWLVLFSFTQVENLPPKILQIFESKIKFDRFVSILVVGEDIFKRNRIQGFDGN